MIKAMALWNGECQTTGMTVLQPLHTDVVRVRWLPVSRCHAEDLSRWRGMLDTDELVQAERFIFAADREAYTAAHALLRAMLSAASGLPTATWRFAQCLFGKPILVAEGTGKGLRFNLSHTRGLVACAIAYDEVGVDVEAADRKVDFALADQFFAPEEAWLVNAAPAAQKGSLFFRLWTLKEAFIKATGEGLRRPLDSFSFSFDPLRIAFHPGREDRLAQYDAAAWQFFTCYVAESRPLALAVQRPMQLPIKLDMRAARPDEITPT